MPSVSVVVLTGFLDIFRQFQASVLHREPEAKVTVVTSNGIDLRNGDCPHCFRPWTGVDNWTVVEGLDPFVFARNANIGIAACAPNDVFLVNDDVQFTRARSLADLMRIAYEHPEVGILSPQFFGGIGNPIQHQRHDIPGRLKYSDQRLCFTGVYIRREVLDAVGPLDEQFTGYGSEDDDYCYRVQQAGLKLAVTPEVILRHGFGAVNATASFARTMGEVAFSARQMAKLFQRKLT